MVNHRIDWRYIVIGVILVVAIASIWHSLIAGRGLHLPSHVPAGAQAMRYDPNNPAMNRRLSTNYFKPLGAHSAPSTR